MNTTVVQITTQHELKIDNRIFKYYFTPALSPQKPCICILHGHGYATNQCHFKYPNWNVICPIDNFGYEQMGSWYLGEDNNFFWIDAMKSIIQEVYNQYDIGSLSFWGSSMGGYAALVHGYLFHAKCIYANIPQTYLLGSDYSNSGMEKYFRKIGDDLKEFNDLKKLFKYKTKKSIFFVLINLNIQGNI